MMMEPAYDPYDILFGEGQNSPNTDGLLFTNEVMLSDFNTDFSSSLSPFSTATDNTDAGFDPAVFEKLLNELLSSDPLMSKEQSFDLFVPSIESEPTRREMGTDPMEPAVPLIIKTNNSNQLPTTPIIFIQTTNKPQAGHTFPIHAVPLTTTTTTTTKIPTESYSFQLESSSSVVDDYPMEDILPLTPATSGSPDETNSNSGDSSQDNAYSSMLTNFETLPSKGPLHLTNEEVKLIEQEGFQVPTKLPLNKSQEKMLKKIRRKIKNKISAQESRRKKKEYVEELEKQIAKYVSENHTLKERMTTIEKNQKVITKERDLLRSMMGKNTPAPSTALMVFAVFFAVLFGAWSPLAQKASIDDRSLSLENALMPSNNHQSIILSQKSLLEDQETASSMHMPGNHKSRVLLSVNEYDHHQHGPYLPSNNKYVPTSSKQIAAPGYTYSNTVEKYMNKKVHSKQLTEEAPEVNLKRSSLIDSPSVGPALKKARSNYYPSENIVIIEETNEEIDHHLHENKSVKIIRVERTVPAIGNDTLKLAHRTANK